MISIHQMSFFHLDLDLDLGERNPIRWGDELKPVGINLFNEHVGPKTEHLESLTHESKPVDFFNLFFPRDLVETITTQTNQYATQRNATKFKPATTRDIDICLNFMFGIHKLP